MTDRAKLRALLAAATHGPWEAWRPGGESPDAANVYLDSRAAGLFIGALWVDAVRNGEANAALIAAAVNALPGLLDELDESDAAVAGQGAALAEYQQRIADMDDELRGDYHAAARLMQRDEEHAELARLRRLEAAMLAANAAPVCLLIDPAMSEGNALIAAIAACRAARKP